MGYRTAIRLLCASFHNIWCFACRPYGTSVTFIDSDSNKAAHLAEPSYLANLPAASCILPFLAPIFICSTEGRHCRHFDSQLFSDSNRNQTKNFPNPRFDSERATGYSDAGRTCLVMASEGNWLCFAIFSRP